MSTNMTNSNEVYDEHFYQFEDTEDHVQPDIVNNPSKQHFCRQGYNGFMFNLLDLRNNIKPTGVAYAL